MAKRPYKKPRGAFVNPQARAVYAQQCYDALKEARQAASFAGLGFTSSSSRWSLSMPAIYGECRSNAEHRVRKGQVQYRMGCSRCGRVRWLTLDFVGLPHCLNGWWGFLLKRGML